MTETWAAVGIAVVSGVGVVLAGWGSNLAAWWVRGQRVLGASPRPIVRYPRGVCHRCGTADVALRADGLPHARRHRCDPPRPVVTAETVFRVPLVHTEGARPLCGRCRADAATCACSGSTVEVA